MLLSFVKVRLGQTCADRSVAGLECKSLRLNACRVSRASEEKRSITCSYCIRLAFLGSRQSRKEAGVRPLPEKVIFLKASFCLAI